MAAHDGVAQGRHYCTCMHLTWVSKSPRSHSHAWHTVQQCLQASQLICRLGGPVLQLQIRPHTTNRHAARTLTLRPQDEQATLGSQCTDNTPCHIVRKLQCLARARMSHPNWMHSSRRITQCRRSSKSPALPTHSNICCCFTARPSLFNTA